MYEIGGGVEGEPDPGVSPRGEAYTWPTYRTPGVPCPTYGNYRPEPPSMLTHALPKGGSYLLPFQSTCEPYRSSSLTSCTANSAASLWMNSRFLSMVVASACVVAERLHAKGVPD